MTAAIAIDVAAEGRYHRQALIPWWDQQKVSAARILVVGAGALGNEVGKLLALMGVGHVLVFDPDTIERSNLSRSVLFRDSDEGRLKVEALTARMRELNPDVTVVGRGQNVLESAGLGLFLWADVVIGAVDNREARLFINSACARVGRAWVDGAIEGLSGVVRVFDPARSACYECTMNATDWKLVAERRSCAMLARHAVALGHVPSTAVAASIVGGLQVQEALKHLHGQPTLLGEGLHLDGLWTDVSRVAYTRREECLGHDSLGPITSLDLKSDGVTLGDLVDRAEQELGVGAVLELSRDMIVRLACPSCASEDRRGRVLGTVREQEAACPTCGTHRTVALAASVGRDGEVDLALTPAGLGLPLYDVIAARNGADRRVAWLLAGDAAQALGPLAATAPMASAGRTK
jgi:molybdopterin/thiamine biosynthesis adenylyltransferase